jgi:hypothetical protein
MTRRKLSASSVAQQMLCHGSSDLESAIPNFVFPEQVEGNAADRGSNKHELLEKITEMKTADMYSMARSLMYVAELRKTRRFKVLTEVTINATWLKSAPPTTVDVVLHTQDEIHVIDWKTGAIPVEVINNKQLLYYGACFAPLAPKAKGVNLHIVQPWAKDWEPGNASWFADTVTIGKFMAEVQAAEQAIDNGSLKLVPGDHCTFCPANPHSRGAKGKPLCPEMMQLLYPSKVDESEILGL